MIHFLKSTHDYDKASFYLANMEPLNESITFKTLVNATYVHIHQGDIKAAEKLFKKILNPTTDLYNLFICEFAKKGDVTSMSEYFKIMKTRELSPSLYTYNALLNGFSQKDMDHEMMTCLDAVLRDNLVPNFETFDILLNNVNDDALKEYFEKLYGRDVDKYKSFFGGLDDISTYNALLKQLSSRNMKREMIACFDASICKDVYPDVETFNILMNDENLEELIIFLEELKQRDLVTYSSLFNGLETEEITRMRR
eukprot:Awhi_evm1s1693